MIVFTAFGTVGDAVKAVQNGAFNYLVKGDDNDKHLPTASRALEKAMAQRRAEPVNHHDPFDAITGRSPAIQQVIDLARRVAPTEATVLLTGATGTGKEVFAQAVHYASARSKKPFVAVNCGALTRELLESELFGHVAGSFTGALKDRKGLIEAARDGTLFLSSASSSSTWPSRHSSKP